MSLDKQKILNDLGSVMNQLKSADCGCMGKMFSGNAQNMGAPAFGCQQGWGNPACGGHQQGMPMQGNRCMNCCNPSKLFADTYGYLNQNLMQPVIREVYDDLKSLSPANTVMNNPIGNQLGLAQGSQKAPIVRGNIGNIEGQNPMGGNMGMPAGNAMTAMPMGQQQQNAMNAMPMGQQQQNAMNAMPMGQQQQNAMNAMPMGQQQQNAMNAMSMGQQQQNAMNAMPMGQQQQNPMGGMGGMGGQIMNMMMGSKSRTGQGGQQPSQGGNMNAQMGANQGQYAGNMQGNSSYQAQPTEAMGANAARYNTGNMGATQDQFNSGNMGGQIAQYSAGNVGAPMQNPTTQYMTQPNAMVGNMNQNPRMGNTPGQPRPAAQQGQHGMHSQGIAKFNEMFPGVMEGMEGNLDFDPMAIALQMNPANKQGNTMKTMQKLLTDNNKNRAFDANATAMKPVMNGMNAVNANLNPNQAQPVPDYQVNQQMNPNQEHYAVSPQMPAYQQQQIVNPVLTEEPGYQEAPPQPMAEQIYQEQIYQEQPYQEQPSYRRPEIMNLPEGGYPNQIPHYNQLAKDPILPVDTSRTPQHEYNTLGQPIETFPVRSYHSAPLGLPQTLSPSPEPIHTRSRNEPTRYSNVKSTVSRTSLFGNRAGGRTSSRSQLQHVYNQYKGSHSYTSQNIRNPVQQQHSAASAGRLNVQQANRAAQRQIPVERVGGDTIANNQIPQQVENKGGQEINQLGDVAVTKPQGNADPNGKARPRTPRSPMRYANLRNGLQDIAFTSSPRATAWSFHGVPELRRKIY